jgi:hypothetical protein
MRIAIVVVDPQSVASTEFISLSSLKVAAFSSGTN